MPFIEIIGRSPLNDQENIRIRDAIAADPFTEYLVEQTVVASYPGVRCVPLSVKMGPDLSRMTVALVHSRDTKFLAHIKEVLLNVELEPKIDKVLVNLIGK